MATALERPDVVEQALVAVDHDYLTVYGPNLVHWPKGVRGELFETLRSRRTMDREFHPTHPRRASAGRRRRHRVQLAYRIHRIAPGAVKLLVTPVWTDARGSVRRVYVVHALDAEQQTIHLPRGGSHRLTALLQGAFPKADWRRAQTWHADGGRLTVWRPVSRGFRESVDAKLVESFEEFDARLTARGL